MDFRIGSYLDGLRNRVSDGIRELRKNGSETKRISRFTMKFHPTRLGSKLNPRFKGGIFAAAFITVAGALAWGAQDLTYSRALSDWERSRLPSERTWTYALGNQGLASPAPSPLVHQALKKLPASLDQAGSVWASSDLGWIIVFTDPNQTVSHKLFCQDCKRVPDRWEPIGVGWNAFDQVLERLERTRASRSLAHIKRKTIKFVDSREIQY